MLGAVWRGMCRAWSAVADRWSQWAWLDLVITGSFLAFALLLVRTGSSIDVLGRLTLPDRRDVYRQMLQLVSIFAGFASLSFTVYLGFNAKDIKTLRRINGIPLLRVWLTALVLPWLADLGILICLAVDRGQVLSHNVARWVAISLLLLVVQQLGRLVWVFYQLATMQVEQADPTDKPERTSIRVVPRRKANGG